MSGNFLMGKVRLNDNFSGLQAYKMSNSNGYICSHTRSKGKENPENIDLKSKIGIQVFTNIFKFMKSRHIVGHIVTCNLS